MWFYHKTYLFFWKSFGRNRGYFLLFLLYWFVIHKFSKKSLLSTFKLSKSASEIIFQKCVGFVSNLAIKWNEVVFFVKFFFFFHLLKTNFTQTLNFLSVPMLIITTLLLVYSLSVSRWSIIKMLPWLLLWPLHTDPHFNFYCNDSKNLNNYFRLCLFVLPFVRQNVTLHYFIASICLDSSPSQCHS